MSRPLFSCLCAALVASLFSSAAGAQTLAADTSEAAPLPPPMSITQRYVPVKAPRPPLALLLADSPVVTVAEAGAPVVVEEVGARPAIAALAPGRLAISVSPAHQEERHE